MLTIQDSVDGREKRKRKKKERELGGGGNVLCSISNESTYKPMAQFSFVQNKQTNRQISINTEQMFDWKEI